MTSSHTMFGITYNTLFQLFKYTVYCIITYNVAHFVMEDHLAVAHRFRGGVSWAQFTDAYAQAVDSLAWFILLLIFELETWVIDDDKFKGWVKTALNVLSVICYFFIIRAALGYIAKLEFALAFEPSSISTACEAVNTYLSYAIDLDIYANLTAKSCADVAVGPYFTNAEHGIIADQATYSNMRLLGYVEVINALTWIGVVVLLWLDIFMQLRGKLTSRLYRLNALAKGILYVILIGCAVIWGIDGKFMDFWDAFIWIVAFFFIEINIFRWHEESQQNSQET